LDGLSVAPALPSGWLGFTATRIYRGTTYRISVERRGPGSAVSLEVDGAPIQGAKVPLPTGSAREVRVRALVG
jgi:cellobiose phosphorylase